MINILSDALIVMGILFWFWGTLPLIGKRSVLYKLHSLSVADTLGSMSIVVGLLLRIPSEWPLLLLSNHYSSNLEHRTGLRYCLLFQRYDE